MYAANKPPPPPSTVKASMGVDSVHLKFKGVNALDVVRFCEEYGWRYREVKGGKHIREWQIYLTSGQTITVQYYRGSKTTKFEIGRLADYGTGLGEQHLFCQGLLSWFGDRPMEITELHFAFDVNVPLESLKIEGTQNAISVYRAETTLYVNMDKNVTLAIYDKGVQLKIFSTPLSRLELRIGKAMLADFMKAKDFMENPQSFERLAFFIYRKMLAMNLVTTSRKRRLAFDKKEIVATLHNFIGMLQGDTSPILTKDHFKVRSAVKKRDRLFEWAKKNRLKTIPTMLKHMKGKKNQCLQEIGMDHKTFNKAMTFYKGIPNFKFYGNNRIGRFKGIEK